MVVHIGPQAPQAFYQNRRGGLPVHIEIAPNQDFFAVIDGLGDEFIGNLSIREFIRGGGLVGVGI